MNFTGLLRVLFRWKYLGLFALALLLALTCEAGLVWPLKYESQVMLERKPNQVNMQENRQESFDLNRLTSESQRSVALLKCRYMMEHWLDALGITSQTPADREKELKRLYRSLTVQPVSYTDLFVVKVRASSPEEATRRAGILVNLYAKWDSDQIRQQTQEFTDLLRQRVNQMNEELSDAWARLKIQKGTQALSLSGTSSSRQLEQDITARGKLFDTLTTELEESERQLHNDKTARARVLTPPSVPGEPVLSRKEILILGTSASLLAALALILLLEWQDPTIRRSQDIVREVPSADSIMAIPALKKGQVAEDSSMYLGPLSDAIAKLVQSKGSAVVQIASPGDGDGKTTLSTTLARMLSSNFKVCLVHRDRSAGQAPGAGVVIKESGDYKLSTMNLNMSEPFAKHITALKQDYNVVLVDTDSVVGSSPGSNLLPEAEMACVLVSAGRTSRYFFRAFRNELQRLPNQQLVFILNRYEDPLPRWLQPH